MALTLDEVRSRLDGILGRYKRAAGATGRSVLPAAVTSGKTYEAWVLCRVLESLHAQEGYDITLVESQAVRLKSAPGPINRAFTHFELARNGRTMLEVWTDIEFTTLSALRRSASRGGIQVCDYHELDVVVVPAGITGRPDPTQVLVGVECKNVPYTKDMLRSLLGVRRELSLLQEPRRTAFRTWPRPTVPANPPSCLIAFSTDRRILRFAPAGELFGVDFVFDPLP